MSFTINLVKKPAEQAAETSQLISSAITQLKTILERCHEIKQVNDTNRSMEALIQNERLLQVIQQNRYLLDQQRFIIQYLRDSCQRRVTLDQYIERDGNYKMEQCMQTDEHCKLEQFMQTDEYCNLDQSMQTDELVMDANHSLKYTSISTQTEEEPCSPILVQPVKNQVIDLTESLTMVDSLWENDFIKQEHKVPCVDSESPLEKIWKCLGSKPDVVRFIKDNCPNSVEKWQKKRLVLTCPLPFGCPFHVLIEKTSSWYLTEWIPHSIDCPTNQMPK